jgi:hypothetical protein
MPRSDILLWTDETEHWAVEADGSRCEQLSPSAIQLFVHFALMCSESSQMACEADAWTLSCLVSATTPENLWTAQDIYPREFSRSCPALLQ